MQVCDSGRSKGLFTSETKVHILAPLNTITQNNNQDENSAFSLTDKQYTQDPRFSPESDKRERDKESLQLKINKQDGSGLIQMRSTKR